MSIIKTWNRNFKMTILFHSLTKQQFKFCKEINNISKNVCAKKTWFLLKKKQKLHLWIKFFTLNFNSKNRNVTHKFYIVITVTILIVWHHGWLIYTCDFPHVSHVCDDTCQHTNNHHHHHSHYSLSFLTRVTLATRLFKKINFFLTGMDSLLKTHLLF